jgi:hypothetical protein
MRIANLISQAMRTKEFIERPIFRFVIIPFVFLAGPTLAVTYYSIDIFRASAKGAFPSITEFLA